MSVPNPNIPGSEEAQWVLDFVLSILILVIAVVLAGIVLYFSFALFAYFQHPDDNDKSIWSKFVVISSIWLVIYIPIFSAMDFASVYSGCPAEQGGLGQDIADFTSGKCMAPMKTILYSLMGGAIFWNYWLIPFTLVLRENSLSESYGRRFLRAFLYATLQGGVIIGIAVLFWRFTGKISITTHFLVSGSEPYNGTEVEDGDVCINGVTGWVADEFDDLVKSATTPVCRAPQRVSFVSDLVTGYDNPNQAMTQTATGIFNYIQSIHVVMGWFVLSVLGGVGLAAMPWKLINDFIHRERVPMTRSEYIRNCQNLRTRATELKEAVEKAKDDPDMSERDKNQLKQKLIRSLVLMEKEDEHMTRVFPDGADPEMEWTTTVIGQWVGLAYGLVGLVISCLWIAQITSYGIADPPFYLGLNRIFALKDGQLILNLFSLVLLVIFSLHLNYCCNQGLFSFCMFFPFLAVHPLTAGTTMIDQFLCQSQVGLYSAPALLAFQVSTLPLAAARSNTSIFFGFQFQYLEIWGFLFQSGFYMYLMLTCFGLTVLVGGMKEIRRIFKVWMKKRELAAKALIEDY